MINREAGVFQTTYEGDMALYPLPLARYASVAAGYVDPYVGGGTKDFLPYVLMILALMIRPYGFFGREIIERV